MVFGVAIDGCTGVTDGTGVGAGPRVNVSAGAGDTGVDDSGVQPNVTSAITNMTNRFNFIPVSSAMAGDLHRH
jgi:hypothetical protein